ncbi:hypothetical protein [Photobacterium sagamiensis]
MKNIPAILGGGMCVPLYLKFHTGVAGKIARYTTALAVGFMI